LIRLVSNKPNIFKVIHSREQKFQRALLAPDVQLYLEDVQGHVTSLDQSLLQLSETLTTVYSEYIAQGGINQALTSQRLGDTMKKVRFFFFFFFFFFSLSLSLFLPSRPSGVFNSLLLQFTAVACIVLPLNLIAGILGSNIQVPLVVAGVTDSPMWFWLEILWFCIIFFFTLMVGRRYRWFTSGAG